MNLGDDFIKKLKKNTDFQLFLEYITEIYNDLDSIKDFDLSLEDDKLGQGLRARKVARHALYKILLPFIDFREKKEPTKEQKESAMKKYGL